MENQGLRLVLVSTLQCLTSNTIKTRYPEEDLTWYNHVHAVPFLIDDLFAAYTCLMRFTLFLATRTLVHWREGGEGDGGREGGREGREGEGERGREEGRSTLHE